MSASAPRDSHLRTVVRVSSGNFLEMYDFMVFGYYAADIGRAYFPSRNPFLSLMSSLMTFGAGFLMRPIGAVVLGAYVDRVGRRRGLLLTLGLMSVGTLSVACTPVYEVIGVLAPLIVVAGRLLQGFSAGVELGGVSVYLSEIAPPGRKGFYVSWQSASQQVAVVFAAVLGVIAASLLAPAELSAWGWRIPLLVGCLIIPFLFAIRGSLQETDEFARAAERRARSGQHPPDLRDIARTLARSWHVVATGMLLVTTTTVAFYTITAYTPTFGTAVLHLPQRASLTVALCVGVSNLFWLPTMGALSDRVGRRPLLLLFSMLTLATAYPTMAWLAHAPSFGRLLSVQLWLSFLYASYNGAMVVYLTEIVPAEVRTAGFSLAYSLATALFGGFTPYVSTLLIHLTDNRAMPGAWLSLAALCGAAATIASGATRREAREA